jgi:hypothetical protein
VGIASWREREAKIFLRARRAILRARRARARIDFALDRCTFSHVRALARWMRRTQTARRKNVSRDKKALTRIF